MLQFPIQCDRIYANSGGNLSASGFYRSHVTQELANMFPRWMHIRTNPRSRGQQFFSPLAIQLNELENKMDDSFKSKFITTAPVDEIDVIYRTKLPSNVDITDSAASGVRCIASPSGFSPSGVGQLWLEEITDLEAFYYHTLPTRLEVISSGDYANQVGNIAFKVTPTGVLDLSQKYVDDFKVEHDLTWAYADEYFRKQDRETMENYETYPVAETGMSDYNSLSALGKIAWLVARSIKSITRGYGVPIGIYFYDDLLWWIGKETVTQVRYYLNIINPKTQIPAATTLDLLATFDITSSFDGLEPSGIIIDEERTIWILDTARTRVFGLEPRYDYFTLDKDNRYVYFREDYRNSGVFISNN